ncbi:response regulator transcription factor [Paenibacillus polysaccharolyticus]|uniref:Two-component system, OmpR family, response regulator RegX3 n=1 Tax=Paenibacillus polysaccharolyticus TaxID=582692 RepID=A0A1G5LCB1_9BACL|nr:MULTISPECIES: response regulator transcription factor [Paenibacillus]MCP1131908.1 response regulator transcription factor [Paenibacillus polysaccharolyticus]MDP9701650.1 two-component system response regulator RegX3 [Paenibacillus intestini]SCZ10111.1 two-component system, OmpR family, response regulator RegX3 [Paenibacillus polysaccharolyticus]
MSIKVLLIEDEKNLADMIAFFLDEEGYITERVHHPREALHLFSQFQPDIVVTDLMLPEIDGNELVDSFRQHSTVPVLMISASTMLNDRLRALHNGADDFLCKPFSLKELDARIKALLRRSIITYQDKPVKENQPSEVTGHISVNEYRRTLFVDSVEIDVTHIEFEIMKELYRNPGKVFTRNELMDRIKGSERAYLDRTIDVHISSLRKKIEPDPKNPRFIKTVWGTGYKYMV